MKKVFVFCLELPLNLLLGRGDVVKDDRSSRTLLHRLNFLGKSLLKIPKKSEKIKSSRNSKNS